MQPITAMRNSLGKEYGGSGVPIDEVKYRESVDFWSSYASIKSFMSKFQKGKFKYFYFLI